VTLPPLSGRLLAGGAGQPCLPLDWPAAALTAQPSNVAGYRHKNNHLGDGRKSHEDVQVSGYSLRLPQGGASQIQGRGCASLPYVSPKCVLAPFSHSLQFLASWECILDSSDRRISPSPICRKPPQTHTYDEMGAESFCHHSFAIDMKTENYSPLYILLMSGNRTYAVFFLGKQQTNHQGGENRNRPSYEVLVQKYIAGSPRSCHQYFWADLAQAWLLFLH
jgi:hypothetical protein